MEESKEQKKLAMTSTKQEMLQAYNTLLKQLEEKQAGELKPEKKIEEKKIKESVQVATSLTADGVGKEIAELKMEIGKTLTRITDQLEGEVNRFVAIRNAISAKEKELQELYEIEKVAMSLAALIEAQNQKRQEFTSEMDNRKEILRQEIDSTRTAWEKEQEEREATVKERDAVEKKRQTREKEEFEYAFKREQQLTTDRFTYEKTKLEKELKDKKEHLENELRSREAAISEREAELNDLRKRAVLFPKELETAVSKAVKDASERLILEAKTREELLKKEAEGERNVSKARLDSLEKTVKEQSERIAAMTKQLEAAYQKVQDIAIKTVEGASNFNSVASLQQLIGEQVRKQTTEK
jgi:NADH/NAD ratio-sensing transcriptional regulator Rex